MGSYPAHSAIPEGKAVVHLQPLGEVDKAVIEDTAQALTEHAGVFVVVLDPVPLPASTESNQKGRYRAEKILEFLSAKGIPVLSPGRGKADKIMGVTTVDIVTKKGKAENWGILGLGAIDGRSSVISTFRMGRHGASAKIVKERLWKITVHELGHTLGLDHCKNRGCLMMDAHGTIRTVDRERALCPSCKKRFVQALEQEEIVGDTPRKGK